MALHTINKVCLDFTFPGGEKETVLAKARQLFMEELLPRIEARVNLIPAHLSVDKLELDLGMVSEQDLRMKFEQVFSAILAKQLETAAGDEAVINIPAHVFPSPQVNPKAAASQRRIAVSDMLHFLSKGYWPWQFQLLPEESLQPYLRALFASEEDLVVLLDAVSREQVNSPVRLLHLLQSDPALLKPLLAALLKRHPVLQPFTFFSQPELPLQKAKPGPFAGILLTEVFRQAPLESNTAFRSVVLGLLRRLSAPGKLSTLTRRLEKQGQQPIRNSLLIRICEIMDEETGRQQQEAALFTSVAPTAEKQMEIPADASIRISNAGLILFHPYLPLLFNELGWLNSARQFRSPAQQQRAVLLLQYLINGKSRQPEHELVLNKLLCGWPVEKPLSLQIRFTAKEKQAVQDMALSLIEHWSVLKNTSLRGLTESFINRKGMISKTADGYQLQVETRTIDILMESLPYGIQTIKLPWNESIIHTAWTN